MIGDYIIRRTLGKGSTGHVQLGVHHITGQKVAIKSIPRDQLAFSRRLTETVQRELAILQLLYHPNLIELYQVLQDRKHVYLITEYAAGGELFDRLNKENLSEEEGKAIFIQIVNAVHWCHQHHICHRDLKLENILLDEFNRVKVADFGMATMQSSHKLLQTSCGSSHYASPEIVRGIPYYGPSSDVWSVGVILYVILIGELPFDDLHIGRLLFKIKSGRFKKIPGWISEQAKDLLMKILVVDPAKRITISDILSHPWIASSPTPFPYRVPIHPNDLIHPIVLTLCDKQSATWETFKILWRDLNTDQILSSLTASR
ncbi:kinase-like domain-containing protein [Pilobolus umbonatus]|nr:kinase-like domain-containing protein [Pilobolus umbonatus]